MSYSEELKAELLSKVPGAGHCVLAELAGMMCCGGAVECGEDGTVSLVFSTEKENLLDIMYLDKHYIRKEIFIYG